MSFKPKVISTVPGNEKSTEIAQLILDRVPEELWEEAYMDILIYGCVHEQTIRKILTANES